LVVVGIHLAVYYIPNTVGVLSAVAAVSDASPAVAKLATSIATNGACESIIEELATLTHNWWDVAAG